MASESARAPDQHLWSVSGGSNCDNEAPLPPPVMTNHVLTLAVSLLTDNAAVWFTTFI
ncbi:hypothetical protein BOX15_Mlig014228g3 [Macrostomum lignano]|uniref:Uncharacterized protein n=1 Tax=Macrostomum lignano TaxID=282301 RepID=A0A267F0B8_9PLAT|nr:hypothetical protein BOX15_Mlig014228g3 [Macrostomum lignano]